MALLGPFIAALLSGHVVVLLILVLLYLHHMVSGVLSSPLTRKQPPGPTPLPLIGNLLQLDLGKPYRSLYELSKKYGTVFTVHLGHKKVVVLAGYKAVKAAVVGYEQYNCPLFKDTNPGGYGTVLARALKDFGMSRNLYEDIILEECGYLVEVFKQHEGTPFDTTDPVNYAVSNVIASLVYGSRFEYGDPLFTVVVCRVAEKTSFACSATVQFYNLIPRVLASIRQAVVKNCEIGGKKLKDFVIHLKETLNPDVSRGLVDCFLIRQQKEEDAGVPDSRYSDQNLLSLVDDLFAIGTDTSAILRWALLLMAKYPEIQDRVQEELDRVLGGGYVSVEDWRNLPFTNAVIHETQRLVNTFPMAVPYQACQDLTFQGYFIEEGTTVFALLTSALYDESEWENPHTFNPSHFLDQEGKFIQHRAFVAFSKGCKVCLDESLAKMELFILFTSVLQRFRFTAPPGVSEDQLARTLAGVAPPPHQLCVVDRWR